MTQVGFHGPETNITPMLMLLAGVALLFGSYGRFRGIGTWPLGIDEFYISRSIDNVLRSGLPAFPCGGYYTRGLIYQYLVAAVRLAGLSPEAAARGVAGVSSLALLPAAFLLGKRVHGPSAGWLAVILLCVSVWEIEMARFARMYAPFQAVFSWYAVAYLRFTVDRHAAALGWMIALSVLGVMVWEGGVLLGVANLFAIVAVAQGGRLRPKDWFWLVALGVLLVLLYLATRDLRGFADPPIDPSAAVEPATPVSGIAAWLGGLGRHPLWCLGLLPGLALSLPALRWILSLRDRGLVAAALALILVATAAHVFLLAVGVLAVLLLSRWVEWPTLTAPSARYFWWAAGAFFLFWLGVGVLTDGLAEHVDPGAAPRAGDLEIIRLLAGFPNVADHILRPWLRTVPILSAGLCLAFGYWCVSLLTRQSTSNDSRGGASLGADPLAALLTLIIVLALAVGASPTERVETRYTFFLYPLLLVLAVAAILRVVEGAGGARRGPLLAVFSVLVCFAVSEDFQPRHVIAVDSEKINFRIGMPVHRVEHYYPRNDIRGVAEWLNLEVRPGDVVITGIPSLEQYYKHIDYFFLDESDTHYETYVCADGKTERWTNLPLLYTVGALRPIVARHRVFASVFGGAEQRLRAYASQAGWTLTRVWTAPSRTADVVLLEPRREAGT